MNEYYAEGTVVRLDKDFANSSFVIVVSQSPLRLYTIIQDETGMQWEVMTNRLDLEWFYEQHTI